MDVSMASPEVGATEDVVRALLNYLVDPLLPTVKSYARAPPSLSQQQAVAKQVHALVLIYSYYLRKSHRELEFLCFESFLKLAVILKPSLMAHMKLMHRSDIEEVEDLENQLSPTEKAIMDACDISSTLDPSKDDPGIDGWPICKVAVMLVDSRKENCFLLRNSVTYRVCSVIEKDVCLSIKRSEPVVEGIHVSKRIRSSKKISNGELATDEAGLQQLAFSAVKEAAGIDQADLMALESHVVYSLSKERAATRFYIMQCTKFIKDDLQVPFVEVIKRLVPVVWVLSTKKGSLKGTCLVTRQLTQCSVTESLSVPDSFVKEEEILQSPLVQMSSFRWMMTPAVKYFHMLPYAGILSDWLSREVLSNSSQVLRAETETLVVDSSQRSEDHCCEEVKTDDRNGVSDSISNDANGTAETQNQDNNHRCLMSPLSSFAEGPVNMHVDNYLQLNHENEEQSKVSTVQRKTTAYKENNRGPSTGGRDVQAEMVDPVIKSCVTEHGGASCGISSHKDVDIVDVALVPSRLDSKNLESLQTTLTSKEDTLSRTALRVLLNKRDNLFQRIQNLQEEIAVCDKRIQMVTNGVEGDLAINIEADVDGGKDLYPESIAETRERTYQHLEEQDSHVYTRRKRLSEASRGLQDPCEVLDEMCHKSDWRLPTYRVSPSDGGFVAEVSVKGADFDLSVGSEGIYSCPREARQSAASKMVSKLM